MQWVELYLFLFSAAGLCCCWRRGRRKRPIDHSDLSGQYLMKFHHQSVQTTVHRIWLRFWIRLASVATFSQLEIYGVDSVQLWQTLKKLKHRILIFTKALIHCYDSRCSFSWWVGGGGGGGNSFDSNSNYLGISIINSFEVCLISAMLFHFVKFLYLTSKKMF